MYFITLRQAFCHLYSLLAQFDAGMTKWQDDSVIEVFFTPMIFLYCEQPKCVAVCYYKTCWNSNIDTQSTDAVIDSYLTKRTEKVTAWMQSTGRQWEGRSLGSTCSTSFCCKETFKGDGEEWNRSVMI